MKESMQSLKGGCLETLDKESEIQKPWNPWIMLKL